MNNDPTVTVYICEECGEKFEVQSVYDLIDIKCSECKYG